MIERQPPIHLDSYKDNEYLVVRLLYNKVDKKNYIDTRIFELVSGKLRKTEHGLALPIKNWEEIKQRLNEITRRIR